MDYNGLIGQIKQELNLSEGIGKKPYAGGILAHSNGEGLVLDFRRTEPDAAAYFLKVTDHGLDLSLTYCPGRMSLEAATNLTLQARGENVELRRRDPVAYCGAESISVMAEERIDDLERSGVHANLVDCLPSPVKELYLRTINP